VLVRLDGLEGNSDTKGEYTIANIHYGTFNVEATKTSNGEYLSANPQAKIMAPTNRLDIVLHAPPAAFRTRASNGKHRPMRKMMTRKSCSLLRTR